MKFHLMSGLRVVGVVLRQQVFQNGRQLVAVVEALEALLLLQVGEQRVAPSPLTSISRIAGTSRRTATCRTARSPRSCRALVAELVAREVEDV